tara:strand:+ start:39 stop:332 length:294 start_codon:yes stop_codon:yes gene_type:complete
MAQVINGARASWANRRVETLDGNVTVSPEDSGKVFLCAAATVTLPSASDAGAGWNALFVYKSGGATTVNSSGNIDAAGDFCHVFCDGSAFYNALNLT